MTFKMYKFETTVDNLEPYQWSTIPKFIKVRKIQKLKKYI